MGEAQGELVDKFPGCEVLLVSVPVACTKPDGTTGTDLYLSKDGQAAFAADLSAAAFRLLQSTQQFFDVAPFIHPAKAAAWQTIRTSPPAPHRGRRSGDLLTPRLACPCPPSRAGARQIRDAEGKESGPRCAHCWRAALCLLAPADSDVAAP
ncbi:MULTISPECIES: hypothetical protein [unclassified Streptomyces]|uniref:hypothetical protein n=1 Tax=unclassified Streptomyces TaxID=2593676 RepID=UPI0033AE7CC8